MKKENDFMTTYHAVCSVLPRELAEKLRQESPYWAPEVRWYNLTHFINTRMKQDSNDPQSVKVYAALMGLSERRMKKEMKKLGL